MLVGIAIIAILASLLTSAATEVEDEFIELKNISPSAVPLFDPAHPTNTWRLNGVGYTFPMNLTLAAGQTLLLVATGC